MDDQISALEAKQNELTDAVIEMNSNLASMGYSTTESIKAIMEGFQSMNNAIRGIVQNFAIMEEKMAKLEKKVTNITFTDN